MHWAVFGKDRRQINMVGQFFSCTGAEYGEQCREEDGIGHGLQVKIEAFMNHACQNGGHRSKTKPAQSGILLATEASCSLNQQEEQPGDQKYRQRPADFGKEFEPVIVGMISEYINRFP